MVVTLSVVSLLLIDSHCHKTAHGNLAVVELPIADSDLFFTDVFIFCADRYY